ncbi:MAG: flagellar export chaperone FlgN [Anaerotignum sp.]|nr:flagellar export chaperone FlgN [Anaerotignum sp.]
MTATILDFNSIVLSLIELIKELTSIERNKLKAVTANDLEALNACIKYEQVQGLKLKGLDKKREQIQASLGYENRTFKEIIPLLADEERKESKKLYSMLQQVTDEFNAVNSSVKTALDVNMHSINTALSKLGLNPDIDHKPSGDNLKNRFA